MNNIAIAKQTIKIMKERKYECDGKTINLPDVNFEESEVFTPEDGKKLIEDRKRSDTSSSCVYRITNEDSFKAASKYEKALVMNFANAHHAGGGFMLGANAQEESLCRCSTLYASISSDRSKEMYRYNNTHLSPVESDYMIYSPNVCVFRNEKCDLIEKPFMTSVITVPAPNKRGAALLAGHRLIEETMLERIRIIFLIAAKYGHKNLVLGAWGCGAFGNDPEDVAEYFRKVLVDERYGVFFSDITFAVYGKEDGKNIRAFREKFQSLKIPDDTGFAAEDNTTEFMTERLILRLWCESDAESCYEYAKDPAVGPIAGWPVHTSIENSREIIKNVLSAPQTYAVCLREDNKAIGSIGLLIGSKSNISIPEDEAEIGYWIGVPFWGNGYIPEAVRYLIKYAFETLNMKKLWCGYFDGNIKSKRAQEKCGFRFMYTLKDIHWDLMNDVRTEHITCLTREEYYNKK